MLLIFDEADLSLHPKWQRMFMKWLTDFCEHIFKDISIKIIVTTHSPILLSDFPGNSVLYIKKCDNKTIFSNSDQKNTFGCNIHSLFLNSFFLENYGTMGALAEEKINKIAEKINKGEIEQESLVELEKTINYIGEGIIKSKLEVALREKRQKKKIVADEAEKTVIQETVLQLRRQKIHLEQMIANLEENYLLEPLDKLITEKLGLKKLQRYMDDIVIFASAKKVLHNAIVAIKQLLGQRFRLKLKHNWQVCKFYYAKGERKIGRALDFMGFVFYRTKTLIRKNIMLSATRLANKMERSKEANRGYFHKHIEAMLSYMEHTRTSSTMQQATD